MAMRTIFLWAQTQSSAQSISHVIWRAAHCFWWVITSEIFSPLPPLIAHREFIRFSLTAAGWVSWQNAISSFMSRPVRALCNFARAVNFESSLSFQRVSSDVGKIAPAAYCANCIWELRTTQTREKLSKAAYKFKVVSCFTACFSTLVGSFFYFYIFIRENVRKSWRISKWKFNYC